MFPNMKSLPIVSPPTGSVDGRGWEGEGENLKFLKIKSLENINLLHKDIELPCL